MRTCFLCSLLGKENVNCSVRDALHHLHNASTPHLISVFASGADVNSSASGDSPLHIAARLSSPELVSVLLDHGANHSLRNLEGKQPLDITPPNSRQVERLLRQAGDIRSKQTK